MSQRSLLVVDDEIGVRESIRLIFGKTCRLFEAQSSQEAIRKVTEEMPDVILLDIMMPGSDGLETLKKIKGIHPDAQVIMLTALNTARTAFTAKETGAFDYVTKPFDVDELRLRVDRAM
jgi:DNA-binding NtrC family response regulator